MLSLLLAVATTARAAEVTDMAPGAGALVGVTYGGSALAGRLVESGTTIADRRVQRHDLDICAEVAPIEGLALTLGFATTPSLRFAYPNAREMVSEPATGSGSYLAGPASAETPAVTASGLQGVWLGAAVAPFAERYQGTTGSTWRLDVGFRTGSKNKNLWTAGDSGRRGVAPGGTAFKVQGAFSSDRGVGQAYVTAGWIKESAVNVDVVDEDGRDWGELALQPASTVSLRGGIEIVAFESGPDDPPARFAVDLFAGAGYRSWEDVSSGVYLPNVLDSGRQIPVTVGDQMIGTLGMAFDYHAGEVIRGRTGATFTYVMPYRVEHVYDVRTSADTYTIGWSLTVQAAPRFVEPKVPSAPTQP